MPAEWRLSFYANEFRAVSLSSDDLFGAVPELFDQWVDDVPEGFRFFLELTSSAIEHSMAPTFLGRVRQLGAYIAGLYLAPGLSAPPARDLMGRLESALGGTVRLSLGATSGLSPYPAGRETSAWSEAWTPDPETTGRSGGWLGLVDRVPSTDRGLRELVEAFIAWSASDGPCLLRFPGSAGTFNSMRRARIIAELLGH